MLGAIIGDVIGSPYEFGSRKTKDFELFCSESRPTDDSVMTIAVGVLRNPGWVAGGNI